MLQFTQQRARALQWFIYPSRASVPSRRPAASEPRRGLNTELGPPQHDRDMGRARLVGEPSGLRIRVPLAGMPSIHGIRNSGQRQLPAWASVEQRPSEWVPPPPSFEDDTGRQHELARYIATVKQIVAIDPSSTPELQRLAETQSQEEWTEEDVGALWPELEVIEQQAAQRNAHLQRIRAHLQSIAHGELGVRTRHAKGDGRGGEAEPSSPRVSMLPEHDASTEPPSSASAQPHVAPPPVPSLPPPPSYRYTGLILKFRGITPSGGFPIRPEPPPEAAVVVGVGDPGFRAQQVGKPAMPSELADADSAPLVSGGGGGGGGGGGSNMTAAARRAAAAAHAKAAAEARQREELGEAAGYTSLRIKPASSINPRHFWAAVDDYMRPLPMQAPPLPPLPPPLPDRCPLTDRLLSALLPVPTPLNADVTEAGSASAPAGAAPSDDGNAYTPAQLELGVRSVLIDIGLLTGRETAPELQHDAVGEELRRLQAELVPLARQNAARLDAIQRRAATRAAREAKERMNLADVTREVRRQERLRRLQEKKEAKERERAPKRKKAANDAPHPPAPLAAPVTGGDATL